MPAKGWPEGTDYKQANNADMVPDWRWRLSQITDMRPDGQRPVGIQLPPPGADITPSDPKTGYFQAAARHQANAASHYNHLRRLVFPAGIGVVTVPLAGVARHVVHEILTRTPGGPADFAPNTLHEASLEPTADPQPEIETADAGGTA